MKPYNDDQMRRIMENSSKQAGRDFTGYAPSEPLSRQSWWQYTLAVLLAAVVAFVLIDAASSAGSGLRINSREWTNTARQIDQEQAIENIKREAIEEHEQEKTQ